MKDRCEGFRELTDSYRGIRLFGNCSLSDFVKGNLSFSDYHVYMSFVALFALFTVIIHFNINFEKVQSLLLITI